MKEFIEKLIGRLEEITVSRDNDGIINGCNMGICEDDDCLKCLKKKIISIVNQLAEEYINCSTDTSTNTSSGWIPTSERLPEKNAIVLTCDKDGWISIKVNMPYAGVKNDFECGYYTAWMPLPEPFKPKGE